jgi:uncharacterized protein
MSTLMDWSHWESRLLHWLEQRGSGADVAHDTAHIRRVVANARRLAVAEGARLEIVLPAAWLHDCVTLPKDSPDRGRASTQAARCACDVLRAYHYPEEYLAEIVHAIEAHSFSAGIAPRTLEAMVVQDADRLDALGAIGIARCMLVGGSLGRPLYNADDPFATARPPDDTTSTIDHFSTKLFTIATTMQTTTGQAEARTRCAFMHQFLAQLGHEIGASPPPGTHQ